ncbi:unnamed protein product [Oikopleura dioica]|uniref:Uncharacterized protein n=1 Tax=Oikopleura dioica TaxID=34765 RepID=E4YG88_OIKDI|nr:unnamed protein product [Oikopleura dioica]
MKFSLIFIQIAAGWVTERRCIALKLICSGGSSSFVYDEACMGDVPPNGRMIINPSRNARKGYVLSLRTEALTCRQSPSDGLYMPWTERQTREYSWNTELGRLELENAYAVY